MGEGTDGNVRGPASGTSVGVADGTASLAAASAAGGTSSSMSASKGSARNDGPPQARPAAIAGVGIDLLRIDRIERALARRGDRFASKILGPQELAKFAARRARDPQRGIRFLATRFAAKEAFSKAIGLGMRMPMVWTRMQTLNAPSGKPMVVLAEPLRSWYDARFGAAHVSITDESDMAAAYVVVEMLPAEPASNAGSNAASAGIPRSL
ncbi:holo-[acyl-carrier protein] synthase [Pigmentiphaga litoralis]|nr:holo-[acyl-carrier protein] synthase [Pigmentiphaga litoralis]